MIRFVVVVIVVVLVLWALSGFAVADNSTDAKCQALRDLNAEYRGRSLSIYEKSVKAQMVAWYRANCLRKDK